MSAIVGPSVMRRKLNEAGYFVVLRNERDQWVSAAGSAVLRVPSVIVPDSNNYLFNPEHPDFARMVVDAPVPYVWDPRVLRS
jgi:RES domain-containing protein